MVQGFADTLPRVYVTVLLIIVVPILKRNIIVGLPESLTLPPHVTLKKDRFKIEFAGIVKLPLAPVVLIRVVSVVV